jgi:ABC-type Na+ transport system ATPase subunit NatA
VVHEDLTVRENLAYNARLRLSAAKPAAERAALVEDCIDLLQLRHVQHQVVGTVERRGIRSAPGATCHRAWKALTEVTEAADGA